MQRLPNHQAPRSTLWRRVALPPLGTEERQGFADYFAEQTVLSLLIGMPITALLHLFMITLGVNLFPEQKLTIIAYHLVLALGSTAVFLLARNRVTAAYLPVGGVFIWLYAAVCVAVTIVVLEQGVFLYIGAVIFTLLYICGIIRATFLRAIACCGAGFLLVNVAMYAAGKRDGLEYLYANSFMTYAAVIGLTLSYTIERLERSKYLLQRRLEREKKKLDDYSAWLRQLAVFLRHEVRQPIAQINSSIELVALKRTEDPSSDIHLRNAMSAAQQVWHLIERASRATDAEAFVRQARPEHIEVQAYLQDLLRIFSQTYSGVTFSLSSSPHVHVRADPVLFKEAVSNLLSNAASFADDQTDVVVSLEAREGKAEIKIYNQGPRIEGDTEVLFQPFTTSRSGAASEHHGLGLYLVRLIAQQHGGTATINNAADGKGVEASLYFPAET
ncbi:sensor histidine kinase [Methylobacterium nigriterrae]|uniref:sensor histidine kinase n=1 Tax=Methylobacterium nigriterrae TaxID=3127512 RepID=UPI003013E536